MDELLSRAAIDAKCAGNRADAHALSMECLHLFIAVQPPRTPCLALLLSPWQFHLIGSRRLLRHRYRVCRCAEESRVTCQGTLQDIAEILEQMPAVSHLN